MMPDPLPFVGQHAFWIVAVNTLLHELGVPLPMMPTALIAGARVASGAIEPVLLVVAIVTASLVGNALWFAAGRRYGTGVLQLLCRFSPSADTCVSHTQTAFGRWGWSLLVIGRFVPGISLMAPPMAGALGMGWTEFLMLTATGAGLYGLVVIGAGMLLADQIESMLQQIKGLGWEAAVAVTVILVLYAGWRLWRRRVARTRGGPDAGKRSGRRMPGITTDTQRSVRDTAEKQRGPKLAA